MAGTDLTQDAFKRMDEGEDRLFYEVPRLVTHIDEGAIAALTSCFKDHLPASGDILDLMSSCVSHYPDDVEFASVTGLGMNRVELDANPRLTTRVIHDLNHDPILPFDEGTFDACTLSVSVQYLTRPSAVFTELARVLKPGAPCIISYSNRCFPTKAVAVWRALDDHGHGELIAQYFAGSKEFAPARVLDLSPARGRTRVHRDPLYVVVADAALPL
jgi:SAM-dependent methyltransferase